MTQAEKFFPSIGSAADQADLLPEENDTLTSSDGGTVEETEDKPTQEIESLCMKCGEQVSCCPQPSSCINNGLNTSTSRVLPECS
jgi:hypothetical protein